MWLVGFFFNSKNASKFYFSKTDKLLLEPDPSKYTVCSHGVLTVDGINDKEEMLATEVCSLFCLDKNLLKNPP